MIMISSATLPSIQDTGVSNFVLLPQEAAFLAFSGKLIQSNLENTAKIVEI
jgi:hypothetical protein